MVSDPVTYTAHSSSASADFSARNKKKRGNSMSKLRWPKLDARRKQSLSHVVVKKKEGSNEEATNAGLKSLREENRPLVDIKMGWSSEQEEDHAFILYGIDSDESPVNSPTSVLDRKGSWRQNNSAYYCSGIIMDEDEEFYFDAFDDCDTFADALSTFEKDSLSPESKSPPSEKEKPSPPPKESKKKEKDDDEPVPSTCPICYEDLDETDLSFLPCPCKFRLCLFCHRRIVEGDGLCPACRKPYDTETGKTEVSFQQRGQVSLRLSPSFRGLDRA